MSEDKDANRLKRKPTGDYPVGFARPPEVNRWKKGQSGNPGGRRKGPSKRMIADMIRDALNKKITINSDGREERITILEAAVRRQANDLVSATPAQRYRTFNWLLQLGWLDPSPEDMRPSAEARAFLAELGRMVGAEGGDDTDE
jgi:hypothetical protein